MPTWGKIAMAVLAIIGLGIVFQHGSVADSLAKDTFAGLNTGIGTLEGK